MAIKPGIVEKRRSEARLWHRAFLIGLAVCVVAYLLNILLSDVESRNAWGLSYGIAATLFLVGVILLGWRRRAMGVASRLRLGRSRTWLYLHIYGGILFLVLAMMHSGLHLPTGSLTWTIWLLSVWTTASGLLGLLLQKWIPRALTSGLSIEVNYDRIPELIDQIRERAERIAASCGDSARRLYGRQIAPSLVGPHRSLMYVVDITGGIQSRLKELRFLRKLQSGDERKKLDELEQLYRTKLEIDAHYTLQWLLRWWLYFHVPTSLLLLACVVVHIFVVTYY